MDRVRRDEADVRPVFIDEYLDRHPAAGEVRVRTGAWNTGWHDGTDFLWGAWVPRCHADLDGARNARWPAAAPEPGVTHIIPRVSAA